MLTIWSSKLKSLTQDDLKLLTQLEYVRFYDNDLESLDGDLFEFNPKLKYIDFESNKIKYVGENLFNNLNHLQRVEFQNNYCTNEDPQSSSAIPALIQKLISSCRFPSELIKKNETMEEEIAEIKNMINQKVMEMISVILALKAENTRLANLLKDHETKYNNA